MDHPKIDRLLRMMSLMTGNVRYTLDDLADRMEISRRTVFRYISSFKEAGFVVNEQDGFYSLGKESPYFKDISELIHFTEEEAYIFNKLIDAVDDTNLIKENLRRKLTSVYKCTSVADTVVKGKNASNVNRLVEAIEQRRKVILHDYRSSHSDTTRDRSIEAFGFTTNYVQIWGYDPEDGENKLFNTSRIGSVEVLDEEWSFESEHRKGFIDIFRFHGYSQHPVTLRLGILSHNLLIEEYPLSERDITQEDDRHWILRTEVCSWVGIGRFVIGLKNDIEIIDSPELEQYLNDFRNSYLQNSLRK